MQYKAVIVLSKTKIINGRLARQRLIHDQNWELTIDQILAL